MSKQYSPRAFFRQSPNRFLKRYFSERQALTEIEFDTLSETKIEPIYEAWLALSDNVRNEMQRDFQDIDVLATEGGSKAILDEARWHGEDLASQFAELKGFHEHAFWTFLERPRYWQGALAFHHADSIPECHWRKRKNLPRKPARVDPDNLRKFSQNLASYFHTMQGRGKNCQVDCYKREGLDYFFAYPESYAEARIEWEGQELKRRPRHPAFEVIFVYSSGEGTLDIYLPGDRKPIPDLQAIFAGIILNEQLGPDAKDERVYDLEPLKSRHFQFVYGAESGIIDVAVKKLRLRFRDGSGRIVLEADPSHNPSAVLDLLDKVTSGSPPRETDVTQVGLKVTFAPNPSSRRINTRSFDITWPNSCSLKHDGRDLKIRRMLIDSGIEPRETIQKNDVAA